MKMSVSLVAVCVLICGWPARAQESNQPGHRAKLATAWPEVHTAKQPSGLEKRNPDAVDSVDEPPIVLRAFASPFKEGVKPFYRLSPKQIWNKAVSISQISQDQYQRFIETGQPMFIDQDGIYLWRDFYTYTKGIVLANFFQGKLDVGLYERRFTSTKTLFSPRPLVDFGARRPGEGGVFSGGRQIFVGLRLDIGKIF